MKPLLKWGLSQPASDALRAIGLTGKDISQTIGHAAASAGTHAQDGTDSAGRPYCAAVDLRIGGRSEEQIRELLGKLGEHGFAAWYRCPGCDHWPESDAEHIHAVYAGVRMKAMLQRQVHDWCHVPHLNGLASHAEYAFWQPTAETVQDVRDLFLQHNPA